MTWTNEHGPDQLYEKFTVLRKKTGEQLPKDEFVFVLRPERDKAAWEALANYAYHVAARSPQLAQEIRQQLQAIWNENE